MSITVLSPVEVGDKATLALLRAGRRVVDDNGRSCVVCVHDWGPHAVVHVAVMSGGWWEHVASQGMHRVLVWLVRRPYRKFFVPGMPGRPFAALRPGITGPRAPDTARVVAGPDARSAL
jgi:hypothetical protein